MCGILADTRPNDAPIVQKTATAAAKLTVDAVQTFRQEMKSLWQEGGPVCRIEMTVARFGRDFRSGPDKMAQDLAETAETQDAYTLFTRG